MSDFKKRRNPLHVLLSLALVLVYGVTVVPVFAWADSESAVGSSVATSSIDPGPAGAAAGSAGPSGGESDGTSSDSGQAAALAVESSPDDVTATPNPFATAIPMTRQTAVNLVTLDAEYTEVEYIRGLYDSAGAASLLVPNLSFWDVESMSLSFRLPFDEADADQIFRFACCGSEVLPGEFESYLHVEASGWPGGRYSKMYSPVPSDLVYSSFRTGDFVDFTLEVEEKSPGMYFDFILFPSNYCNATWDLSSLTLYDSSEVIIANLVSCIRNSDEAVGFFDTVSGNFITHTQYAAPRSEPTPTPTVEPGPEPTPDLSQGETVGPDSTPVPGEVITDLPLWDKPFEEYTPTEGLLLCLVVMFVSAGTLALFLWF